MILDDDELFSEETGHEHVHYCEECGDNWGHVDNMCQEYPFGRITGALCPLHDGGGSWSSGSRLS